MYPWIWLWNPSLHLPWSGDVAQRIEPDTDWFFGSIDPRAGNGRIEKRAFEVASYGKQLGLITEVLLAMVKQHGGIAGVDADSLRRLEGIQEEIGDIKRQEHRLTARDIEDRIAHFKRRHPEDFAAARARLLKALEAE